jgi:cytochrome c-type biogenesis protein CcmE
VTPKTKSRIYKLLLVSLVIFLGIGLILYGASNSITFFYTPSQLNKISAKQKSFRLGGVVKPGTVKYLRVNTVNFTITDSKSDIEVIHTGMIPKLFREGQVVVVKGSLRNNIFIATEILAKHDENYSPPGFIVN